MPSQPNDIDDPLELHRQIKELNKAGKSDEAWLLAKRRSKAQDALRRQIADLRNAGRYAEAVPLADRLAQAVEASFGAKSRQLAEALIDLAELLIAVDRSAEAAPLLQRAFAIIAQDPYGEIAVRERFSHIDTSRLIHAVPVLRDLLGCTSEVAATRAKRMYSREPSGAPRRPTETISDHPVGMESRSAPAHYEEEEEEEAPPAPPSPAPKRQEREIRLSAIPTDRAAFRARETLDLSTPQGALAIEAGRLAYQIPNRMWVGVQETVEVRLGAVIAKEIMQGFVGRGDVKLEHVPIVETMSVSLVCQPGTFDIEPRSKDVQLVKPDLVKGTAFHQDDFARWTWIVTPRQRGKHTLFVKVSAAIKDSRGLPTTSSLPDKIIRVTVRVDLVRAATGAFWRVAPGLAWAVATTLVGIFTKDYWWPAVRPWLGM